MRQDKKGKFKSVSHKQCQNHCSSLTTFHPMFTTWYRNTTNELSRKRGKKKSTWAAKADWDDSWCSVDFGNVMGEEASLHESLPFSLCTPPLSTVSPSLPLFDLALCICAMISKAVRHLVDNLTGKGNAEKMSITGARTNTWKILPRVFNAFARARSSSFLALLSWRTYNRSS